MNRFATLLAALAAVTALGACSQNLAIPTSSSVTTGATPKAAPKRLRPVVAGRPARMYVFAGFKEKNCEPVPVTINVTTQPRQGKIEVRQGQSTTIMHSASGNCIGKSMAGTGVYYVPNKDADGPDSFTVVANTGNGGAQTKTFSVDVTK